MSEGERLAPVGLPGLMTTIARTSVPSDMAFLWASRMELMSVPQALLSSR